MRTPLLLLGAALALTGCATAAQGATSVASSTVRSAITVSPAPTAGGVPTTAPDPADPMGTPTSAAGSPVDPTPVSPTPVSPTPVDPSPVGPSPASPSPVGPAPVGSFVLGDSISLSAGVGPVLGRFGYPVVGQVGRSVGDGYLTEHLTGVAAQAAPAWVIELGTNNPGDPADVGRLAGWLDLIDGLRTPGAEQTVYWVTPYRPADLRTPSVSELDAFTAELVRLAAQRPWLKVLDFAALAKANPDWLAQDAMHLHPDAAGQAALVALIAGPNPSPVPVPVAVTDAAPRPAGPVPTPDPVFDNSTM